MGEIGPSNTSNKTLFAVLLLDEYVNKYYFINVNNDNKFNAVLLLYIY